MRKLKLAIWSLLALIMVACGGKDSPASNFAGDAPKDEHSSAEQDAGAEGDTLELVYGIPTALYSMQEGEIASGQTFSTLLEKLGVDNSTCNNLLAAVGDKFDVRKMQAGRGYHAYFDGADSLAYLLYEASQMKVVVFRLQDTLGAEVYEKIMDTRLRYSEVEISNSLWLDTQNAGCSYLLALRLSDIYAWTIDFFGLQKGDSFKALYEESSVGGKVVNIGKVYNVVFRHNGKEYNCFYFEEGDEGGNVYWNEKGESFRKAFLKAPLSYSRISSGFTHSRRHPITRRVQPHTGVDYAAPKGTPVVSIGDGVVQSTKYEGAGGNTVRIKHNSVYRSAYLHLSGYAKGIRPGVHVSQGQLIGYVGSTGRSTGPHLDFRIWKNDVPVNPLTMEAPNTDPIAPQNMPAFEKAKEEIMEMLDNLLVEDYYRKVVLDPLSVSAEIN